MTESEVALARLEKACRDCPFKVAIECCHNCAQRMAKVALREKTERDKGCEYCTGLSKYKGFGYAEFFHQTAVDECFEISIDVKSCPNCGRKLNDEEVKK